MLVMVVGSGIQVSLVENGIFGWAYLQTTCFQVKGRDREQGRNNEVLEQAER
jgi:hypothetical protein